MDALATMICAPAEFSSVPVLRARVKQLLIDAGADETMYQAGMLSATELLSNAVRAATDPSLRIGLVLDCAQEGFTIVVDGPGAGPSLAQLNGPGAGPDSPNGRGLALVRGLGGSLVCVPSSAVLQCRGLDCHGLDELAPPAEVRHAVHCSFPSFASSELMSGRALQR